jgi:hypothetical protein
MKQNFIRHIAMSTLFWVGSILYTQAQTVSVSVSGSVSGQPLAAANAGGDLAQSDPTFTMSATTPSVGTGKWTLLSGTATIDNDASPTTTVSGIPTGMSATLRWTITSGSCNTFDDVVLNRVGISVRAKVFLEGAYSSTTGIMSDALTTRVPTFSTLIPTTEPYTGLGFTHQGGGGGETRTADLSVTGNNAIVDWVFIELRDKANSTSVLYTRSALLQRDGDVVDVDGSSPVTFGSAPSDNYFIAVKHRNHLGFRPLSTVTLSSTPLTLDFTNNSITLYGSRPALKEIATGIYGMYSGDTNHDGVINSVDKNSVWRLQNGSINYLDSDFNLNGIVNALDKNSFWLTNNSKIQQLD